MVESCGRQSPMYEGVDRVVGKGSIGCYNRASYIWMKERAGGLPSRACAGLSHVVTGSEGLKELEEEEKSILS